MLSIQTSLRQRRRDFNNKKNLSNQISEYKNSSECTENKKVLIREAQTYSKQAADKSTRAIDGYNPFGYNTYIISTQYDIPKRRDFDEKENPGLDPGTVSVPDCLRRRGLRHHHAPEKGRGEGTTTQSISILTGQTAR